MRLRVWLLWSQARARCEALYSTGRVMIEKRADTPIMPTPIQQSSSFCVEARITRPMMMTNIAIREENCTMGTSCERNASGA